jgi:hypothetical protein
MNKTPLLKPEIQYLNRKKAFYDKKYSYKRHIVLYKENNQQTNNMSFVNYVITTEY